MSNLFLNLRNVPDDEADDLRTMLDAKRIACHETRQVSGVFGLARSCGTRLHPHPPKTGILAPMAEAAGSRGSNRHDLRRVPRGRIKMRRLLCGFVVSALLFLVPQLASATLTYTWQPLTAGSNDAGGAFLVSSGKLVATGPLQYDVSTGSYDPGVDYGSPFSLLDLTIQGSPYGFHLGPNLSGNLGDVDISMDMAPMGSGIGSRLTGFLYANNAEMDFYMTSSNGIWSFLDAHSDFPGCFTDPWCSGGTGQWVLTAVPEPRDLGIIVLGLGAFATVLFARRRAWLSRTPR